MRLAASAERLVTTGSHTSRAAGRTPLWYGARTYSPSGHPASTFGAAAFHDPVRDGTGWFHGASRTPLAQGPVPRLVLLVGSAPLRFRRYSRPSLPSGKPSSMRSRRLHASRRFQLGPLAQSSPGGLTRHTRGECTHLAVHFPLRCFQRFLLPDIATQPAGRPTTAPPAVRPIRSSRTKISSAQYTRRP